MFHIQCPPKASDIVFGMSMCRFRRFAVMYGPGLSNFEEEVCLPYSLVLANPLPSKLQSTVSSTANGSRAPGDNVPMRTDACMRASLA
jgi:hypothetical protein